MSGATRLLVVSRHRASADAVRRHLEARGLSVVVAADLDAAITAHRAAPAAVAVVDLGPGSAGGMTVLRELLRHRSPPECIVVAEGGSVASAVGAIRAGAFDCVARPFQMDDLAARVLLAAAIHAAGAEQAAQPPPPLEEVERRHIAAVLARVGWHQGRAATILQISPKTLYRKMRVYGFRRPRRSSGGSAP